MSRVVYNPFTGNFDFGGDGVGDSSNTTFTAEQARLLKYFEYDSDTRILSTSTVVRVGTQLLLPWRAAQDVFRCGKHLLHQPRQRHKLLPYVGWT